MHVVYGLEDPRDHLIHYVGITDDVYTRFNQHVRGDSGNIAKNGWIFECRQQNIMIIMRELQRVDTYEIATERERYWIRHYLDLGHPLNNAQIARSILRERARLERHAEAERIAKRRLDVMQRKQAELKELALGNQQNHESAPLQDSIDDIAISLSRHQRPLSRALPPFASPEIRKQVIVAWNAGYKSCRAVSMALCASGHILGKDTALKIIEDLRRERLIS